MRSLSIILTVAVLLVGTVLVPGSVQAQDDGDTPSIAATVVEAANSEQPQFTTLLAALEAAELVTLLDETGPFTVFAPTDEAFASGLEDAGLTLDDVLADEELLLQTLLLHVVPGTFTAETVATLDGASLATAYWQSTLNIAVGEDGVTVNEQPVIQTDLVASNGVIHVIDGLLLPGDAGSLGGGLMSGELNIVDIAAEQSSADESPEFVFLVAAAQAAGLADPLAQGGPFTLFAPTDAAFEALLADLGLTLDQLVADEDLLTSVLQYHVVPLNYFAADLSQLDGALLGTLLPESALTISAGDDGVAVNGVAVVTADVVGSNGVIHVIDAVLVPPMDEGADAEDGADTDGAGEGEDDASGEDDAAPTDEGDE
jgi:transforming growth factor-beta-induced protein